MKKIVIGVLAHVDSGKTTLCEAMLYQSGSINRLGRVDRRDSFLDTFSLERSRGITIFSKQAVLNYKDTQFTLLDTPGHVDFSAETERTLQVLDCAVLVISATDGIQSHTQTLWKLLKKYNVPCFIFINKMDLDGADRERILNELKAKFKGGFVDFESTESNEFFENAALCDEALLNKYYENNTIDKKDIISCIKSRKIFPCMFGSALRLTGVREFLDCLNEFTQMPEYSNEFAGRVFKISEDKGQRLTFLKVTGGVLKVKEILQSDKNTNGEKVNQIRIYSGEKFKAADEAPAGTVCAVTGISFTRPGDCLGAEKGSVLPVLEPVLTYRLIIEDNTDAHTVLEKMKLLEGEDPQLKVVWSSRLKEIQVQLMGNIQLEILQSLIKERFGISVSFSKGSIIYKETIADTVEGIGHFEPLRHYAEVHLLLEPGEPGSGVQCMSVCSEDLLDRNWQRLILTHLMETEHRGVLTGAPITDIRITLVSGKAHLKHTEGGDFRQAVYRAVRQGLKQADSVLLEPYYEYRLELPSENVGRAMTDIERMHGTFGLPQTEADRTILTGTAPVSTMRDYQKEVHAYTRGNGTLQCTLKGYAPCHNTEEVLAATGYDSERDTLHPTGSVFCAHGAGFLVPWYEVKEYMHLPSIMQEKPSDSSEEKQTAYRVPEETDA